MEKHLRGWRGYVFDPPEGDPGKGISPGTALIGEFARRLEEVRDEANEDRDNYDAGDDGRERERDRKRPKRR